MRHRYKHQQTLGEDLIWLVKILPLVVWVGLSLARAQTVHITHLDERLRSVEISDGTPGSMLARAKVLALANATEGYLLHDQAATYLQQRSRNSAPARISTAGGAFVGLCAGGVAYGGTRIHSTTAKATWAGVGLAVAGGGCLLWQLFHQQVLADVPNPSADIAHLLPDSGVMLDRDGSWSGLLVAGQYRAGQ